VTTLPDLPTCHPGSVPAWAGVPHHAGTHETGLGADVAVPVLPLPAQTAGEAPLGFVSEPCPLTGASQATAGAVLIRRTARMDSEHRDTHL
jgi:hypothetical protein